MMSKCVMANATGGGRPIYPNHWQDEVFAVIRVARGARITLCKRHLDRWLDLADDRPETEPREIRFL